MLLLLTNCDASEPPSPVEVTTRVDDNGRIDCRISGAREYERFCLLERLPTDDDILIIRKPDGGFRRLRLTGDGRGVEAADGAEQAAVTIIGDGLISVDIGGDSFRLPARVQP